VLTLVANLQSRILHRLANIREDGATAVEYGLMLGLMTIVLMVGAVAFSNKVNKNFNQISDTIGRSLSNNP
jgi:Flp pilus assembly pilin Flp